MSPRVRFVANSLPPLSSKEGANKLQFVPCRQAPKRSDDVTEMALALRVPPRPVQYYKRNTRGADGAEPKTIRAIFPGTNARL